ncbi:D-Ala-D-Ala carboxypeptidase family metallohydrolase [Stenotrophomonas maltophilia]|uniref:D-Ala-D-Ala carboxypeptidase family metallohydrolase n=1 Tax=Stenotrophomonas maltophilia TaxID=40324 RepID=UPI00066CCEF6|nr:D-Ala-D-Ala carboxypeptidase family metallohydrolase [Stenotrophomonas maltophilia]
MATFYESFAQGMQNGLERQKAVTQRNMLAELQQLAPKVIAGDLPATDRAFALDPKTAQAYQTEGGRQHEKLIGLAKSLKQYANSPQMQAGIYRSAVPYLKRNFGAEIPDQFDATTVMPIVEQVLSVANNTPNISGQTPTDVRSFEMMTTGLSPEQKEEARQIQLGLKGRASNAGYGFFEFQGADGLKRMGRNNPRTGSREVYDESTGEFVPLGGTAGMGAAPQAPTGPQPVATPADGNHFAAFSQLATEFPAVTMTSGVRSAERNAQVGGQPNSQHLTGTAADYTVPNNLKPAFLSRARQLGYHAIDEGDHIHLQLPRGASNSINPALAVGRSPEDQAARTAQATTNVENANFPNKLNQERQLQDVKTQGAITQAAGTAAAEAQAKDAAQRPKRIQQYRQALTAAGNVETSLDKALGLLSPYSTGFVGARSRAVEGSPSYNLAAELETIKANLGFDRLQQMRDSSPTGGALGAIAVQELVALQSTIANLDPNQSESQIRANIERVKTHYKKWRSTVEQSLADEERAQSAAPAVGAGQHYGGAAPSSTPSSSNYSNLWN